MADATCCSSVQVCSSESLLTRVAKSAKAADTPPFFFLLAFFILFAVATRISAAQRTQVQYIKQIRAQRPTEKKGHWGLNSLSRNTALFVTLRL